MSIVEMLFAELKSATLTRSHPMTTTTDRHDARPRRSTTRSHLTGEFVLRSGVVSNEYFDKYRFEADPALLRDDRRARWCRSCPTAPTRSPGLELGGVPIATVLSQLTGIPALFVRKEAKTYGTCQLAEGGDDRRHAGSPSSRTS